MVHARTLDDTTLTFIVSGKLWRNSLIMMDEETRSLWSHITGEALDGRMKGTHLRVLPSVQTTWNRWVQEHPETKLLRKEEAVRSSRYQAYFDDPDRTGLFRAEWLVSRMPGKDLVHGVVRGPHALAVSDFGLGPGEILNVEVGEDPLVMVRAADGGVRAFIAQAGGRRLHFHRAGKPAAILDKETGSNWDLESGESTSGELAGTSLEEVVVRAAFWFAWSSFFPNTAVVD